jgi:hypothetical protein
VSVDVLLQTLDGEKLGHVYDVDNILTKIWPCEDRRFPLLQYIDPYGDVLFNGSQMNQLIVELRQLIVESSSDNQKQLLQDVMDLALRCHREPHTFLRFFGD